MSHLTPAALRRSAATAARTMSAFLPALPVLTAPASSQLTHARSHCTRRPPPDKGGEPDHTAPSSPSSPLSPSSPSSPSSSRSTPTMIRGFPNEFNNNPQSSSDTRIFERLVDFPCVFTFKVIGVSQGNFVNDIVDAVALALKTDRKFLKTSLRNRGKYQSITLEAPVNTAEQIYNVYAAIDRDPRVKFKF